MATVDCARLPRPANRERVDPDWEYDNAEPLQPFTQEAYEACWLADEKLNALEASIRAARSIMETIPEPYADELHGNTGLAADDLTNAIGGIVRLRAVLDNAMRAASDGVVCTDNPHKREFCRHIAARLNDITTSWDLY